MADMEIIIQEIKALGYLFTDVKKPNDHVQPEQQDQLEDNRKLRLTIGNLVHISKQAGYMKSSTQICFYQAIRFPYNTNLRILNIQIYKQHKFTKNDDYKYQLNAQIDLSDFSVIKGDYIQAVLTDIYGSSMGRLLLIVDVFRRGPKFYQKVISTILFEKVKQQVQKQQRQHKVSAAGRNIRNLLVNNQLSNYLMTINSMHIIPQIQDTQIFNKQCTILIRYGPNIKAYTKLIKSQIKDTVSFIDYFEFTKNEDFKFQFLFIFIDQLGVYNCKARGQIKYILFDQTINAHTIVIFDRKSVKYGVLMVKFGQKQVQGNPNIIYKIDKKIKQYQNSINQSIDTFNRYKFQAKYNNHLLSQKINQIQLLKQKQQQQKSRPMNDQQKKKAQQHKKFIEFMQKQVLRIQRELYKRQEKKKQVVRKQKYLPNVIEKKLSKPENGNKSMKVSVSSSEFRDGKMKLPKV